MATLLETIAAEALGLDLGGVTAPSLDGLTATRRLPIVTKAEVHRRFRAIAKKRDRAAGEQIAAGDQVQVSRLAYAGGKLVPGSIRFATWVDDVDATLPGFRERLTGLTVGAAHEVGVVLPDGFPPGLAGKPALFRVDVLAAREVLLPDPMDDAAVAKLGRGKTIDAVMRSLAEEALSDDAALADLDVQNQVLDQLVARLPLKLTEAQLVHELRRRWADGEGAALAERSFDETEQQEALAAFVADPRQRQAGERALRVTVALGLVRQRDQVTLSKDGVTALIESVGKASGVAPDEYRQLLKTDGQLALKFQNLALHVATVDHVMAKAKVTAAPPLEAE